MVCPVPYLVVVSEWATKPPSPADWSLLAPLACGSGLGIAPNIPPVCRGVWIPSGVAWCCPGRGGCAPVSGCPVSGLRCFRSAVPGALTGYTYIHENTRIICAGSQNFFMKFFCHKILALQGKLHKVENGTICRCRWVWPWLLVAFCCVGFGMAFSGASGGLLGGLFRGGVFICPLFVGGLYTKETPRNLSGGHWVGLGELENTACNG